MKGKKPKFPSELRFDLVSKDWVIIATGRARRPSFFKKKKRIKIDISKKDCPFFDLRTQERPVLAYFKGKEALFKMGEIPKKWTTIVIPNKYPVLLPYSKLEERKEGKFYKTMNAVGFAELVLMKDHKKHFPHFNVSQIKEVFEVYQKRYLDLMKKRFVNYISIFHNHGIEAGASQPHPHSQIITTPLIDVDLKKALVNSGDYFKKNKKCIYCEMNAWERKVRKRIVAENKYFLAVCPFASKHAFQVIVSPKKHLSYFEKIDGEEKQFLAEIFSKVMKALYRGLADPSYNFYLHTAPCDGKDYSYYHWHWTVLPKTAIPAGFELGTRMEISIIEPEKAAQYLRAQFKKK
ncbi:MAG: galactose-1-phosphate uridylyltransferase [Patescibacteria group bacterium]|nr:galactose-1-phosphate uridylyltransferase [Patescibacteria group bacterium]